MFARTHIVASSIAIVCLAQVAAVTRLDSTNIVSLKAREVDFAAAGESGPPGLQNIFSNANRKDFELYRNGIFARHGYIFKRADLKKFFEACSWYKGETADQQVAASRMSNLELKNVDWLEANEFVSAKSIEANESGLAKNSVIRTGDEIGEVRVRAEIGGNFRITIRSKNEKVTKSPSELPIKNVYTGDYTMSIWQGPVTSRPTSSINLGALEWDSRYPLTYINVNQLHRDLHLA